MYGKVGHESTTEMKSLLIDSSTRISGSSVRTVVVGVAEEKEKDFVNCFCTVPEL